MEAPFWLVDFQRRGAFGTLFVAGTRLRFLVPPVIVGVTGLVIFILHNPMRLRRVMAFLYPQQNREEVGYQTYQAMVAIGSGGLTGVGLGDSRQKLGFIPEHPTDFIFAVIGEELGLAATLLVVIAFLAIVICGVYIALKARDNFGMLLASGVSFLMGLQAAINIGVVTSATFGTPAPLAIAAKSVMPDVVCEAKPPVESRLPLSKTMCVMFLGR